LPPVDVEVECGGAAHRVLLRRGRLVLVDHALAAEAAAVALGAPSPPCFEVYRSWRSREQWEIALQPRGPGFHQLYRRPPLPPPLAGALEQGMARGWERRAERDDPLARYVLHKAIRAKAEPALEAAFASALRRRAGGEVADDHRRRRLELTIGPIPSVSGWIGDDGASLLVRVAPDWLRTVGQPRLATGASPRAMGFVVAVQPRRLELGWRDEGDRWRAVLLED
jgi:hypothetical protein